MIDKNATEHKALVVLSTQRVAVFIVTFNAERHVEKVLARIPTWIAERLVEIYLIDDCSRDNTVQSAERFDWPANFAPLKIYKTPSNQGYGGNQKIGFSYAIEKGFDIVVLLHGDGQYAPEALPDILAVYLDGVDAVFGSRFLISGAALKGRMPVYKFIGNRILTAIQNYGIHSHLSEWHCGYRSYRTSLLKRIPFKNNSNGYEFDAEIIIQILGSGFKIREVPIPTFYGDEICNVNGVQYAIKCLLCVLQYQLMKLELFFDPKFHLQHVDDDSYRYTRKTAPTTVHHFVRSQRFDRGSLILDVGGGDGRAVATDFTGQGCHVTVIDQFVSLQEQANEHIAVDLDAPWDSQFRSSNYDVVFALDVLEHLKRPEVKVEEIYRKMKTGGYLYCSTANVGFFPVRLMLLFGFFNYGRRGILDRTHTRLFTVGSFQRLLRQGGFEVVDMHGFGPPIQDVLGDRSVIFRLLDRVCFWLAQLRPSATAYQVLVVARKMPDLGALVEDTIAFVPRRALNVQAPVDQSKT